MTTSERQIIHHLTTQLGAVQVTESDSDVRLDVDNRATFVNLSVDKYNMHNIELCNTMVFVHETDNILVSHTKVDSELPRYRNVVSLIFEKEDGDVMRRSSINLYIDPKKFLEAAQNMETESDDETETGDES